MVFHNLDEVLEEDNVNGKVKISFKPFRCSYCGMAYSPDEIKLSIFKHGFFDLYGKDEGFFGITCASDKCSGNILFKGNKSWVYRFREFGLEPKNGHSLKYNSTAAFYFRQSNSAKSLPITYFSTLLEHDHHLPDDCCSPHRNTRENILPQYKIQDIDKLSQIEAEQNLQVFPRHVVSDPLLQAIGEYCLAYDPLVQKSLLEQTKADNENTNVNIIAGSKIRDEYFRIVDFLSILEANHKDSEYFGDLFRHYLRSPIKSTLADTWYLNRQEDCNYQTIEALSLAMWDCFQNTAYHSVLHDFSLEFISQYKKLLLQLDYNFNKVWNLKNNFLRKIKSVYTSTEKREKYRARKLSSLKKDLEAIEEKYPSFQNIITSDEKILQLKYDLYEVSQSGLINDYLLKGETGTGKDLFAAAIHELTGKKGAFITYNCSNIPQELLESELFGYKKHSHNLAQNNKEGIFKQCEGGTLFLDEINTLSMQHQKKLLRAIEYRKIQPLGGKEEKIEDLTLVMATNKNLDHLVEIEQMHLDFFFRIKNFGFVIPPLRERANDIELLTAHFVDIFNNTRAWQGVHLSQECISVFQQYDWPGNVRELHNSIKRLFSSPYPVNGIFHVQHLEKLDLFKTRNMADKKKQFNKPTHSYLPGNTKVTDSDIIQAMESTNGDKTAAGKLLGIHYRTVLRRWEKLKK